MGEIVTTSFDLPAELGPWFAALVGRPGWHVLGAYDGPELVATGSLFAHGDVGWVTWGATDARHRGRRAQKALLAARIDAARALGLRALVTETGEPQHPGDRDASYRNILGRASGACTAGRSGDWLSRRAGASTRGPPRTTTRCR
jgi:GNAT superfamily N-acetyltransferase